MEEEWCAGPAEVCSCTRVWFVPILLVHFLTSLTHLTPQPRRPPSPRLHIPLGSHRPKKSVQCSQKTLKTGTHTHGSKSAIPAEALAPPSTNPCRPGTWEDPSAGIGNLASFEPEHVPLSLAHSPWKLDSQLLTGDGAQTNTKSSSPAYTSWANFTCRPASPCLFISDLRASTFPRIPTVLSPLRYRRSLSKLFMLPTSLGRIIDLNHSFVCFS